MVNVEVPNHDNTVQLSQMLSVVWSDSNQVDTTKVSEIIREAETIRFRGHENNVVTLSYTTFRRF